MKKRLKTIIFSDIRDGMTILEVMIAVAIFAICVAGMCALIQNGRALSDLSRDHYVAANIAKNRLERVRTFDFDQLTEFIEVHTPVDVSGNDVSGSDYRFRRTTFVSNVTVNLREVTVGVGIRNRVSLEFEGAGETIQSLFAEYQEVIE
ncbi:prepilin-type N-terminal cleavage/methylation domain-containing protein [Verrucomicrobiota bacterium]